MTTCGERLYLLGDDYIFSSIFSCFMKDLLKSTNSSDGGSVWTRLASIPTPEKMEQAIELDLFTAMMWPVTHGVS